MNKNVHVVPSGGGWDVKVEGRKSARHFATQFEAMQEGRTMARNYRSEHIVHGRDGRIRQRDSYGRDPFPPRG
ncbi:MAG: DUF2188 domain-containing protein [Actinobacteria bacterium]|nr:DUF2188 domain-containing protein [Actinomycetota bacterium]